MRRELEALRLGQAFARARREGRRGQCRRVQSPPATDLLFWSDVELQALEHRARELAAAGVTRSTAARRAYQELRRARIAALKEDA